MYVAVHNQFAYKVVKTAPLPDLLKRVTMNKLNHLMNTILNYKNIMQISRRLPNWIIIIMFTKYISQEGNLDC